MPSNGPPASKKPPAPPVPPSKRGSVVVFAPQGGGDTSAEWVCYICMAVHSAIIHWPADSEVGSVDLGGVCLDRIPYVDGVKVGA